MTKFLTAATLMTALTTPFVAWGHGESHDKKVERKKAHLYEETAFGRPGEAKNVSRTIRISGTDNMRFTPDTLQVRQGETVRLLVKNDGKIMHETVIGSMKELNEHYELMKKFPDMEHDEPHMIHLKPGESGEIVWQFTKAGNFHFACLIPGHLEAGMSGKIAVLPQKQAKSKAQ